MKACVQRPCVPADVPCMTSYSYGCSLIGLCFLGGEGLTGVGEPPLERGRVRVSYKCWRLGRRNVLDLAARNLIFCFDWRRRTTEESRGRGAVSCLWFVGQFLLLSPGRFVNVGGTDDLGQHVFCACFFVWLVGLAFFLLK